MMEVSSFSLLRIRKTKSGNIPVASAGRKPGLDISRNTELSDLMCYNNSLTHLNIGACPKLLSLVNSVSPTTSNGEIQYGTEPGKRLICDSGVSILTIMANPDLVLPASLTAIDEEAFRGGAFIYVKLSEKTTSIGCNAFADCRNLACIYIPATTTSIDDRAFGDIKKLVVYGKSGSYAHFFAQNHGFTFVAVP